MTPQFTIPHLRQINAINVLLEAILSKNPTEVEMKLDLGLVDLDLELHTDDDEEDAIADTTITLNIVDISVDFPTRMVVTFYSHADFSTWFASLPIPKE
jgi:hypothetical protein